MQGAGRSLNLGPGRVAAPGRSARRPGPGPDPSRLRRCQECWPYQSNPVRAWARRLARRRTLAAFGLRPGFWPQGQSKHSTPEAHLGEDLWRKDSTTSGKLAPLSGALSFQVSNDRVRVELARRPSAGPPRPKFLSDCHTGPECSREPVRVLLPRSREEKDEPNNEPNKARIL